MAELHDLTALEQAAAVRAGEVSSTELVEHYLDRIEPHGEPLGAFVTVTADLARAEAGRHGRAVPVVGRAGRRTDRHQGPDDDRGHPHDVRLGRVRRLRAAPWTRTWWS